MNYIDKNLKRIIICKSNNGFLMEYCSDSRILSREYSFV